MNPSLKLYAKEKLKKLDPEWLKMFDAQEKEKEQQIKDQEKEKQQQLKEEEKQKKETEKEAKQEQKMEEIKKPTEKVAKFLEEVRGEKGDQGEKGDTGEQGPQGKQGMPGIDGKDGQTGKQGPSGANGSDGINGKNGKTGPKGERGDDGKDAHITDAIIKKIISTIKSLPENERLDISHLRNSQQILSAIAKINRTPEKKEQKLGKLDMSDQRWHGGGGGAPLLEDVVGDINGVNTTFTITTATTHIILHNGIELSEGAGNDYTISGTALEMLWAPESGTLKHRYWV